MIKALLWPSAPPLTATLESEAEMAAVPSRGHTSNGWVRIKVAAGHRDEMLEPAQQIRHALNTSNTLKVLEKAGALFVQHSWFLIYIYLYKGWKFLFWFTFCGITQSADIWPHLILNSLSMVIDRYRWLYLCTDLMTSDLTEPLALIAQCKWQMSALSSLFSSPLLRLLYPAGY